MKIFRSTISAPENLQAMLQPTFSSFCESLFSNSESSQLQAELLSLVVEGAEILEEEE